MILVDQHIGSADLAEPLRKAGLPVVETWMDSGDLAFEGKGTGDQVVSVGIELKKLSTSDLVSSLRTGRLSGEQLPKMLGPHGAYDYGWLIIEGYWRTSAQGLIETYKGRHHGREVWEVVRGNMTTSELEKQVLTLELCGGLHVRFTNTRRDTLRFIASLYHWWSDKSLDRHSSHLAVHTPHSFLPVSDFRAAVQRFPGIGPRASLAVEQAFGGSLRDAVNAHVEEWAAIETKDTKGKTRRLGTQVAQNIWNFVRGIQ